MYVIKITIPCVKLPKDRNKVMVTVLIVPGELQATEGETKGNCVHRDWLGKGAKPAAAQMQSKPRGGL